MRQYTVILEWDPGIPAYAAIVPALPGCSSHGRTVADALANAEEAVVLHLECLKNKGEPIPDDVQTATVSVAV